MTMGKFKMHLVNAFLAPEEQTTIYERNLKSLDTSSMRLPNVADEREGKKVIKVCKGTAQHLNCLSRGLDSLTRG